MSQSRSDREDPGEATGPAGGILSQMIGEGRSFSGRERNCCFLNTSADSRADGQFANISAVSGLDFPDDGRALSLVDWDHDGDLDLWISNRNAPRLRFMRNDTPAGNHFVSLRLVGNGRTTNRDAIGARVEIQIASVESAEQSEERHDHAELIKTLRAGEGFLAQSTKWLHFGLGQTPRVEKVIVHWPGSGTREELIEEFVLTEIDCRYKLVQGAGKVQEVISKGRELMLEPSEFELPDPAGEARIRPYVLLPAPALNFVGFDGRRRTMPTGSDKAVLVNFWSRSCDRCAKELAEFTRQAERIRAAGIEILALTVDSLVDERADPALEQQVLLQIGFPFPTGRATRKLSGEFQKLHDDLIPLHQPLPLPTSLLIDRRGRLIAIYKGSVSVDAIIEDVSYLPRDALERFARSGPLSGKVIGHDVLNEARQAGEADIRFRFGQRLEKLGFMREAAAQYLKVLSFNPDSSEAHHHVGLMLAKQGKLLQAKEHMRRALRLRPDDTDLLSNLGNVFYLEENFSQARVYYQQVLSLRPRDVDTYIRIGNTFFVEGNLTQAKTHYENALRIQPNHDEARSSLIRLKAHLQDVR